MTREDLKPLILTAIGSPGNKAKIAKIAKFIWDHHQSDLEASGDFFYTWQYDMRWAGDSLVKEGKLDKKSRVGVWERLK
ncbi:hypothetical protein IC762_06605 [Bradyrhizobium genosp. L]|uniref:hypothetical protein n=1 Tax=Bradyrhizobium genosp. L TaxID=83637 RepID=UPI0018A260A2|nr:hypothetical protein [Bradyrhizobium genosp. L]QPF85972.1 hypothetical protein IC762_06605 [Bradyrhizobium genosp. L]